MTASGVPAQGLDLDSIEAAVNSGGQPYAYDVLGLVAAVRATRDLAAHLEAELARATGEVSRLNAKNEQLRRDLADAEAGFVAQQNHGVAAEAALVAEREKLTRLAELVEEATMQHGWRLMFRAALSGDTGGGND